jgi:hypothetical protein
VSDKKHSFASSLEVVEDGVVEERVADVGIDWTVRI